MPCLPRRIVKLVYFVDMERMRRNIHKLKELIGYKRRYDLEAKSSRASSIISRSDQLASASPRKQVEIHE
jgi:hypothetical protein